jgi:hypothetical protein
MGGVGGSGSFAVRGAAAKTDVVAAAVKSVVVRKSFFMVFVGVRVCGCAGV